MDMQICRRILAAALLAAAFAVSSGAASDREPALSARSAILMDADSGEILLSLRAQERSLIASTTKIMTAFLICEGESLDRAVSVPDEAVGIEGSSMYLRRGETLTVRDLLYGMMLHSGNDAAAALAIVHSGSLSRFTALMNRRAWELGLQETHFTNPHGLDSEDNYSTASDLALLTRAALRNEAFRTVVSAKSAVCAGRTLTNHNKLLWRVEGCIGVKTGYTRKAGRILVSAAERGGRMLIAVTICDPDDWRDHRALYDYGFSMLAQRTPVYPQQRPVSFDGALPSAGATMIQEDVWKNASRKYSPHAASHPGARRRS